MRILSIVLGTVAVMVFAVVGFAYSGLYDVSASKPHGGLAEWFLGTVAESSIEKRAAAVEVPNLHDEQLLLAGINDFEAMCVACHGAPGRVPTALALGLNPPAPDLAQVDNDPAELFWVTKHGIRMTGMPAWGETHDDASLWPVVALVVALPRLDAAKYNELLERAQGFGHHGDDMQQEGATDEESVEPAHDHSTHSH